MATVLAIAGSVRRASWNRRLVFAAASAAPPGMVVRVYEELAAIPLFDEDTEVDGGGAPASVRRLREEVGRADGLLLSTPEYNWSIPGVLKNAIDWLSRPGPVEVLVAKPVAVMGASSGRWGTRLAQAALRQTLTATESHVLPAPALFLAEAATAFDAEGQLVDPKVRRQLDALLVAFTRWIETVAAGAAPPAASAEIPHV